MYHSTHYYMDYTFSPIVKHEGLLHNMQGFPRAMTLPIDRVRSLFSFTSRVEPGQVRRCSKPDGSGRIGSGGFHISRVEPGHPGLIQLIYTEP